MRICRRTAVRPACSRGARNAIPAGDLCAQPPPLSVAPLAIVMARPLPPQSIVGNPAPSMPVSVMLLLSVRLMFCGPLYVPAREVYRRRAEAAVTALTAACRLAPAFMPALHCMAFWSVAERRGRTWQHYNHVA